MAFRDEVALPVQQVDVARGAAELPADFWVHGPSELRVTAAGEPLGTARLHGPVTQPLAVAVADAIGGWVGGPLLIWAERAGAPVLPPPTAWGRPA